MKKTLFLIVFLFTSGCFSQVARVVQSKYRGYSFNSSCLSINGKLHEFHLQWNQLPQTAEYIQHNVFDSLGKLLTIDFILVPYLSEQTQLTGVFQKSSNLIALYTVRRDGVTQFVKHDIIEVNISSNSFVQHTDITSNIIERHISNTLQIGNDLISYVFEQNVGLKRLSVDLQNYNNQTSELVENVGTTPFGFDKRTLHFTQSNGIEYCSFSGTAKVYKRISANNYLASLPISNWPFYGNNTSLAVSNSGIVVTNSSKYALLDLNLNFISNGLYDINSNQNNLSTVFHNSHFYVLYQSGAETKLLKFDGSMNLVDSIFQTINSFSCELKILGNKLAFSSMTGTPLFSNLLQNGQLGNFTHSSLTYWANIQDSFLGFLDMGSELKAKDYTLNSGFAHAIVDHSNNPLFAGAHSKENQSLIWSASNFITGIDSDSLPVGTKNLYNNSSYLIGPYIDSASYNLLYQSKYTQRYYVSKFTIAYHLQQLANGNPNYLPDYAIREWPGNGNTSIGQSPIIAAFYDDNNNGIYEPMMGDYPSIYGDECVFSISHTSEGTIGSPKIELHSYRFRFHCDSNEVLTNTIFQKNFVIAKGTELSDVYVGHFFDLDIGTPIDDYVGTNVDLGLIYGYNGDMFDESSGVMVGYGVAPPAIGVMTLQGAKLANDGVDNGIGVGLNQSINGTGFQDGIIDNENYGLTSSHYVTNGTSFPYADPQTILNFHYVSQGLYNDGSTKTAPNGVPVKHSLFGNSDPMFYSSAGLDHGNDWNESALNTPGDRRIYGASGPSVLNIGDTLTSLIALIYARDTAATSISDLENKLISNASVLKNLFSNGNLGCGQNFDPIIVNLGTPKLWEDNIILYPNPTQNKIVVSGLRGESELIVMDLKGGVLESIRTQSENQEIDLSAFSDGIYVVQIRSKSGIFTKKVIKR